MVRRVLLEGDEPRSYANIGFPSTLFPHPLYAASEDPGGKVGVSPT
jgi:hypothetical protein